MPLEDSAGTLREHFAQRLPKAVRVLGKVRGLFWRCEADAELGKPPTLFDFFGLLLVGATGIEPVTPTMSR